MPAADWRRIGAAIDAAADRRLMLRRDLKRANVLTDADGRTEGRLPVSAPYASPELWTGGPTFFLPVFRVKNRSGSRAEPLRPR